MRPWPKPRPLRRSPVWIDLEMTGLEVDAPHDRRDRGARHRLRSRDRRRRPRPRRAPAARRARGDGRLRAQDAHPQRPAPRDRGVDALARRRRRRRCSSTSPRHVPEAGLAPLCGNSIGVDRRFLDRYLPAVDRYLHYRSIDVSSFKELCRRWYPEVYKGRPDKAESHRALDDIRESIEEMRYYRATMLRDPTAPGTAAAPDPDPPEGALMNDQAVLGRINELAGTRARAPPGRGEAPADRRRAGRAGEGRARARPVLGPAPPTPGPRRVRPGPRRRRGARHARRSRSTASSALSRRRLADRERVALGVGEPRDDARRRARPRCRRRPGPCPSYRWKVTPRSRSAATVAATSPTSQPSTVYGAIDRFLDACHPQRRAVRRRRRARTRCRRRGADPSVSP